MKRILIATACAAAVLAIAGAPAQAANSKPDALVKKAGGKFKGNNIYGDGDGQVVCSKTGDQHTFIVKVQNDGSKARRFYVAATSFGGSTNSSFTVTYDGEDVTDAVIAGPGPLTNKIAPGEKSKPFTIAAALSDVEEHGILSLRAGGQGSNSDGVGMSWRNFGVCE